MLIYHRTSLFESRAQTVANTVNCVGVMGKGVAAEFRRRYPKMFQEYRAICDKKLLEPGKLWLWKAADQWVLNFPTKQHWRNPSRIEWIEAGLKKFAAEYERRGITDISFPRLGCGNGGLNWDDVRPLMEAYLSPLPIPVYVHDYEVDVGAPEHLALYVASNIRVDRSFEDFVHALRNAVDQRGGMFRTLQSQQAFQAGFAPENQLEIRSGDIVSRIDIDDLRSIWVKLLKGVVTGDAAEWDAQISGQQILSLLRDLPGVRVVEVQRSSSNTPERAVELRHRGVTQPADVLVVA